MDVVVVEVVVVLVVVVVVDVVVVVVVDVLVVVVVVVLVVVVVVFVVVVVVVVKEIAMQVEPKMRLLKVSAGEYPLLRTIVFASLPTHTFNPIGNVGLVAFPS